MRRRAACGRLVCGAILLALMGAAAARGHASGGQEDQGVALLRELGFSAEAIRKVEHGDVVANSFDPEAQEVALVVAATMAVTPAFYLERFRDITSFKRTPEVLQIGRVGPSPSTADFAALTLETDDVNDLRGCRLDACGVKLDPRGMEQLARPDADLAVSSAAMRAFLARYAGEYLKQGNAALIEYRDHEPTRQLATGLRQILDRSGYLQRRWPELFRAVAEFNGSLPPGIDGFLYWSKEKAGPRAVVSLTHVVIRAFSNGSAAVATKQVYASHYSDASLGVTLLVERPSSAGPRTLVIYVNRTRLDVFGGILGGLKRPIVRSRARDGAERTMQRLRDKLERDYPATRG